MKMLTNTIVAVAIAGLSVPALATADRPTSKPAPASKPAPKHDPDRPNPAAKCRAERRDDPAAFKAKYGTNRNKSNAFGKCVSKTARASH